MRFLLRLLFIFLVVSSVLSMIRRAFQPTQPRRAPEPEAQPKHSISGHLVKDPVCGMYIPDDTPFRTKDVVFCSEECQKKYGR
jgi:hypothetical protein